MRAAEQDRPDVAAARAAWLGRFRGYAVDRFVFVDEFGAATNKARRYARAPRGARAVCAVPHGHWQCLSTVAAMTARGVLCSATFDGATDGELFRAFVADALVPSLAPGQVVVLDNLSAHTAPAVRALVEAAGCELLLLPPYSPDLNPIEQAISKVKEALRAAGARTVDRLTEAIGVALASVTAGDAIAFMADSGYPAT